MINIKNENINVKFIVIIFDVDDKVILFFVLLFYN
jgi:hypothetical protein